MESDLKTANKKFNFLFFKTLLFLMFYVSACIISKPFLYLTLSISLFYSVFSSATRCAIRAAFLFSENSASCSLSRLAGVSTNSRYGEVGPEFSTCACFLWPPFSSFCCFPSEAFLSRSKQQESAPMRATE